MPYSKQVMISELKVGMKIQADGGFTCIKKGAILEVKNDREWQDKHAWEHSGLYVDCKSKQHFLDGQFNDAGEVVGFYHVD